jgi:hypothetical protein
MFVSNQCYRLGGTCLLTTHLSTFMSLTTNFVQCEIPLHRVLQGVLALRQVFKPPV